MLVSNNWCPFRCVRLVPLIRAEHPGEGATGIDTRGGGCGVWRTLWRRSAPTTAPLVLFCTVSQKTGLTGRIHYIHLVQKCTNCMTWTGTHIPMSLDEWLASKLPLVKPDLPLTYVTSLIWPASRLCYLSLTRLTSTAKYFSLIWLGCKARLRQDTPRYPNLPNSKSHVGNCHYWQRT